MTQQTDSTPQPTHERSTARSKQAISRIKMLLLLGTFAFPLLLATIWLQIVKSSDGGLGVSARGELISPAFPLTDFELTERGEAAFTEESLRGIWTLFYAPIGECSEVCERNLYHMRQVRLSLNHRMDRVQRAVLLGAEDQLSEQLIAEHLGLRVLSGERQVLMDQFQSAEGSMQARQDAIYLIDPFGNLMMRFPADLNPKSMLKDIKHLLKVSRIG